MESHEGEENEDQKQPPRAVEEGATGYQASVIPSLQTKTTSVSAAVDEEHTHGYHEKSSEQVPLLGTTPTGRGRRMPRKQCLWNIAMGLALLATIVLIVLLVVLSSNAGSNDDGSDDGDQNSTVLEIALLRAQAPFRMLQATGDGNDSTNATDGASGPESPEPVARDPPQVPVVPLNETSANSTASTAANITTPSPTTTTAAPTTTTVAPTTTTPEPPLDTTIQVQIDQGLLQGVRLNSSSGREYLAFLGVPYAQPPLGEFRFKAPLEAEVWNGTYNATKYKAGCVGGAAAGAEANLREDCLYLNVYTPKNVSELNGTATGGGRGGGGFGGGGGGGGFGRRGQQNQFPVIVYLTGDGDGGSTETKAFIDHFITQNVTLVTLNYRMGIFGTLNMNVSNAAGNQGLKDQAMALKWVKDNIRDFGGNRRKLTLFGAPGLGSAHVTAHLLSPSNDGVFKRVVVNSGSVLQQGYFSSLEEALSQVTSIGTSLNCSTNLITVAVTEQLTTCFVNKTTAELLTAAAGAGYNVGLTIDAAAVDANGDGENGNNGGGDGNGVFFPDTPAKLLQNGTATGQKVPAIIGTSRSYSVMSTQPKWNVHVIGDEGDNSTQLTIALDELTSFIKLPLQNTNETNRAIFNQVQSFYFNDTTTTSTNTTAANTTSAVASGNGTRTVDIGNPVILANVTNLYADRVLNHPVVAVAERLYITNNATGTGGAGGGGGIFANLFGGGSNADGVYLFHQNITETANAGSIDGFFSTTMLQFLTSFADTGIPAATNSTGQNITWTPINNQTKPYQALWLNYDNGIADANNSTTGNGTNSNSTTTAYSFQMTDFFGDRMQFWDTFNLTDIYV